MARITVEDCLDHVPNRFELVLIAAKRARQLLNGAEPKIKTNEDKHTVIALREIAEGLLNEPENPMVEEAVVDQGDEEPVEDQETSPVASD